MTCIDINADLGEGLNNEHMLMPYISSCNLACGGHAGDESLMTSVAKLAKRYKVKIGAHPSFPDRENFGRSIVDMSAAALFYSVENQIKALQKVLRKQNIQLHHVKPHGALYNLAASDEKTATIILEVMKSIKLPLKLFVPYGSVISKLALVEKIPIVYEVFADRNYNEDLTLVSRAQKNALITNVEKVYEHVYRMIAHSEVKTMEGTVKKIKAQTVCVHGDTPTAIDLVKYLHKKLSDNGIIIR